MKTNSRFYISKRNKRGIYSVLFIALLVVFTPRILLFFIPKEKFVINEEDIVYLENSAEKSKKAQSYYQYEKKGSKFKRPKSKFDPNDYSLSDWIDLGLSEKQAKVILKFTERGIYSNEQLERIFVLPPQLFALIKDSTIFKERESNKEFDQSTKPVKKRVLIEFNSATQEELESIPGIGSFFAKNIIKYRDRLGGFVRKEQLLEVWKLDIDKYSSIEEYVEIDPSKVNKIKLNSVNAEEMKDHPYMNWNIANSIVKIRQQLSGFKKIDDIKQSVLIDEELFEKLKPYLSL